MQYLQEGDFHGSIVVVFLNGNYRPIDEAATVGAIDFSQHAYFIQSITSSK